MGSMKDLYEAMNKLDRKRLNTSDPAKLAEYDIEEAYLRKIYRERFGVNHD